MSANTFKRLSVPDTFVVPYTANKSWEITSSSFAENRIVTNIGINHSGSIFDPTTEYYTNGQYDRLVYDSTNLTYYPKFLSTSSLLQYIEKRNTIYNDGTLSTSSYYRGHVELGNTNTYKYFPTDTGSIIYVLNVPRNLTSEKILPTTFEIYFNSGISESKIYDDGNYNLLYSGSDVSSSIGTLLTQDSYVGNVFYEQNVAVLTIIPDSVRLKGWRGIDPYCLASAVSLTPSITLTPSATPSVTKTPSTTPSVTLSKSVSATPSITRTASVSATPSITQTPSVTPSMTPSVSTTPSVTLTPSETATPSITRTPSTTPSVTLTPSETATPSITLTSSRTPSVTRTPSISITPSITQTPSTTPSISTTPSVTLTPSISTTPSITQTPSITPSITLTPSITSTPSITRTASISTTPSITPSITRTASISITPSITPSASYLISLNCSTTAFSKDTLTTGYSTDYYVLDLSSTANGSSIQVTYRAEDRPNRFSIQKTTGGSSTIIQDSLWVGSDQSYPNTGYPWQSGTYPTCMAPYSSNQCPYSPDGSLTFTYDASSTYKLIVDVAPQNPNNPGNDNYEIDVLCTPPPSVSLTLTPSITRTPSVTPSKSPAGINQCITFSDFIVEAGSYSTDLRITATDIQLHPVNGDNTQTSTAVGNITLASGFEGAKLYYQLTNYNITNQTGSFEMTVTGNQGQGTYTVNQYSLKGLTPATSGSFITLSQTGSYNVAFTSTYQWLGSGGVDSSSNARIYVDSVCTAPSPSVSMTPSITKTPSISTTPSITPSTSGTNPVSLAYDTVSGYTACSNYPTVNTNVYFMPVGSTLQTGTFIYTNSACTIAAPNGFYSNGTTYWNTDASAAGKLQNPVSCTVPSVSLTPSRTRPVSITPSVSTTRPVSTTPSVTPSVSGAALTYYQYNATKCLDGSSVILTLTSTKTLGTYRTSTNTTSDCYTLDSFYQYVGTGYPITTLYASVPDCTSTNCTQL